MALCPMCRGLGGTQGRSGQVRNISSPTEIRSPDHPARSESLYRLRCPGPRISLTCIKGSFFHTRRNAVAASSQCSLRRQWWLVPTPVGFVPDSFWTQCLANYYIFNYSGAGIPQWVSGWNVDVRLANEWRDFSFPERPDRLFGQPNVPSDAYRGCSGRSFKLTSLPGADVKNACPPICLTGADGNNCMFVCYLFASTRFYVGIYVAATNKCYFRLVASYCVLIDREVNGHLRAFVTAMMSMCVVYISERLSACGSKAYYANQFFFKSRLVSKKSKLKLYCSIIRPTVTYGCVAWVLKGTIKKTS
jgi:hypothetical protein